MPGVAGVWTFATDPGHDVAAVDGRRAPDHRVLARRRSARAVAARAVARRCVAGPDVVVRRTVRDDHPVGVGLVRPVVAAGRARRASATIGTIAHTKPDRERERDAERHDVPDRRDALEIGARDQERRGDHAALHRDPACQPVGRTQGGDDEREQRVPGEHVAGRDEPAGRADRGAAPGSGWLRPTTAPNTTISEDHQHPGGREVDPGLVRQAEPRDPLRDVPDREPGDHAAVRVRHRVQCARNEERERPPDEHGRREQRDQRAPSVARRGPHDDRGDREPDRDLDEHRGDEDPSGREHASAADQQHHTQQPERDHRVVVAAVDDRSGDGRIEADERDRGRAPRLAPEQPERDPHREGGRDLEREAVRERVGAGEERDERRVQHEERAVRRRAEPPRVVQEVEQRVVADRRGRGAVRVEMVHREDAPDHGVRPDVGREPRWADDGDRVEHADRRRDRKRVPGWRASRRESSIDPSAPARPGRRRSRAGRSCA